ncbi:cytosolic phospholipase A2 zeta-like isoform X2 [Lepisosteus oculatus]|uniref:cytosolic phospholipase A2 zeta-like isoform X2 n=1 Tax=Lepisosteus oculatus TaxID=7918 RepID=UPI0037216B35
MGPQTAFQRLAARLVPVFAAVVARKEDKRVHTPPDPAAWRETDPYWNLSVKVLQGKNIPKHDIWSQSDCYVTLRLPTASAKTYRTKTVANSSNPVWNETFHYRIHSHVKNILELNVYDQDLLPRDDLCSKVLFDIDNLSPGKTEKKVFVLDPESRDELWVEFSLEESNEPPSQYITNGVLVAGPFSLLEVKVNEKWFIDDKDVVLKLTGAYEEEQVVFRPSQVSGPPQPLTFYINGDLETELRVRLTSAKTEDINEEDEDEDQGDGKDEAEDTSALSSVLVKSLPAGQEVLLSVPVGEDDIDLQLRTKDCSEDLDVRLSFDIPEEEKKFLEKRSSRVCQGFQRALQLSSTPDSQEVPVVAVVGSGGGTRAMTAFYGCLKGLQNLDILDTVSYISGVSGSTWALSSLYADADWSQKDLQGPIMQAQSEVCKSHHGVFSPAQLSYYYQEIQQRRQEGQLVSVIDLWGLIIEYFIHGKRDPRTLSNQQETIAQGQNPYPIYLAVNMKDAIKGTADTAEWCEFTPHEIGFPKYGAFIRTEDFGSEFYMGHLIKRHSETRLTFLLGLWSSIFSFNLAKVWSSLTGSVPTWMQWLRDAVRKNDEINPFEPTALDTYLISPVNDLAEVLNGFLTDRPVIGQSYNFLRGFSLYWDYSQNSSFMAWKDTHPDAFPNSLTPSDSKLHLVDSGFAINTGFPPLFRPQRKVDIILSFNFTWGDQFKALKLTEQYCADHRLPFPRIDLSGLEGRPLQECYVFADDHDPRAPIVVHFPLTNASFREYRAPGVKRVGEEELKKGEVDVTSTASPYRTYDMSYSAEEFERLVALAAYNVVHSKEAVLGALQQALARKRLAKAAS